VTTMTEIVKRRYETGAYGGTHLRMPSALWAELKASAPPPSPAPLFGASLMAEMLAIPIVVDEEVPAGTTAERGAHHDRAATDHPGVVVPRGRLHIPDQPRRSGRRRGRLGRAGSAEDGREARRSPPWCAAGKRRTRALAWRA